MPLDIYSKIQELINEDRAELRQYLEEKYGLQFNDELNRLFNELHKYAYTCYLWSDLLKDEPSHQHLFSNEMKSDCIQLLNLTLLGYKKPCMLLLRSIMENGLRQIYFHDHEIEFLRIGESSKKYHSMDFYWEYYENHPLIREDICSSQFIQQLTSQYSSLSRYIHSSGTEYMSLGEFFDDLNPNEVTVAQILDIIKIIIQNLNFLFYLYYFKCGKFNKPIWHSFILQILPSDTRRILVEC